MPDSSSSRRAFLATAASAALTARGANDRISIALIGAGGRGHDLLEDLEQCKGLNAAITTVCDVYRPNLERMSADVARIWGSPPFQTADYREVLQRRDIDAVLIATPDFGHSRILQEAVEAGKDAYCEKPMGIDCEEAKAAWQAVKKSKQVVQIGTQRRSDGHCMAAARLLQSGILGKVTRVDISYNFHEPRWRRDHAHVSEKDIAWDKFLFNRPKRSFDARRIREWQLFRDYTNGIAGLWMCHFIDLVHWWLDDPYPAGAVANGGVFLWKDGRETSDVFHALLDYPKGFLVSFAMSLTNAAGNRNLWLGTRGTLDGNSWRITGDGSKATDRLEREIHIEPEPATSHMHNFLECIRSRQTPRASVDAGFSHAVACSMAAQALESGRRVGFDRARLALV